MKGLKKVLIIAAIAVVVTGVTITGFAAARYETPAEAIAGLLGKPVDEVIANRLESGQSYGEIASEAGKLDEFKEELFEIRKEQLQERVEEGVMTQERADAILERIQENQMTCDGDGGYHMGQEEGLRFGGNGSSQGNRDGNGYKGMGQGGSRFGNGS